MANLKSLKFMVIKHCGKSCSQPFSVQINSHMLEDGDEGEYTLNITLEKGPYKIE
jgi:hypothetical protein